MSFPEAVHMHKILYLHAPQIKKMNNIGLLALKQSSACSYIICVGAHILHICDTTLHCHNSVSSVPQIVDNFIIQGKYL